jgi:uncharacterized membrane protein (UPF0182 family)
VAFEDDLATALSKVFSGQTITTEPDGDGVVDPIVDETKTSAQLLAQAILDANEAYEDGRAALAKGDFTAYGVAQNKLAEALKRVTEISGSITGVSSVPTATPSPSPSAS